MRARFLMSTLSLEQFRSEASRFVELDPRWLLCSTPLGRVHDADAYLVLKASHFLKSNEQSLLAELDSPSLIEMVSEVDSSLKAADNSSITIGGECLLRCEVHIVYSRTYRTPVLYFNVYSPSEFACDDVWMQQQQQQQQLVLLAIW
jgi:hypothetical protein